MTKMYTLKTKVLLSLFCLILSGQIKSQPTIGLTQLYSGSLDNGYVLFAPIGSTNTYLIDQCGHQVKTWTSTFKPGQSCYILSDGTLLRAGNTDNPTFNSGGKGGVIEKINWDGNVVWSYTISSALECQHHDIKALPNGNVLAIVWESKTNTEAIAEGRNPSLTTNTVWSEKIIEIQPEGDTGGIIVWEWHLWDHLIQDFDSTKPNYGTINSNPQLLNLNFEASANAMNGADWIHLNSIDYNPFTDQILLSSHAFNEIWIIDHSTTTAQAASHEGGNSNKGGDLLYRWGNPLAYNSGSTTQLFGQHNAYWIDYGLPYQNQIMIFNNGNGRPGGNYSTIEIIDPPMDGYLYTSTLPYLPTTPSWIYNEGNTHDVYAQNISGAQQLSNGHVLYCNGPSGTFTEIDASGNPLWTYINPVANEGIMSQGETPIQNPVFRCSFYPASYNGFDGQNLTTVNTIEDVNSISASCSLSANLLERTVLEKLSIYPNPVNNFVNVYIDKSCSENLSVEVYDSNGMLWKHTSIPQGDLGISIDTATMTSGIYLVKIAGTSVAISAKFMVDNSSR